MRIFVKTYSQIIPRGGIGRYHGLRGQICLEEWHPRLDRWCLQDPQVNSIASINQILVLAVQQFQNAATHFNIRYHSI